MILFFKKPMTLFLFLLLITLVNVIVSKDIHITGNENTIDLTDGNVFVIKGIGLEVDSAQELIKFGSMFGKVDRYISGTPPYLQKKIDHSHDENCMFNIEPTEYYTRIIKEKGEEIGWHSDMSYLKNTPTFSIVRPVSLPDNKTSTMFKDMKMVLNDFPNNERLINLYANHSDDFNTSSTHPVVRDGYLFVNRAFTRNIIGIDDGNVFLEQIFQFIDNHKESETLIKWEIDDILVWNNNFLFHTAVYDYPKDEYREIQRVIII